MKKLTKDEAFAKVELAQTYYEDGAPQTALKLLLEAENTLGTYTVSPMIKLCRSDIKRREKFMSEVSK